MSTNISRYGAQSLKLQLPKFRNLDRWTSYCAEIFLWYCQLILYIDLITPGAAYSFYVTVSAWRSVRIRPKKMAGDKWRHYSIVTKPETATVSWMTWLPVAPFQRTTVLHYAYFRALYEINELMHWCCCNTSNWWSPMQVTQYAPANCPILVISCNALCKITRSSGLNVQTEWRADTAHINNVLIQRCEH
jgi:hypothetical protein